MKRYAVPLLAIALLAALLPWPSRGATGMYNTWSGWFWCSHIRACIHEIGHQLDDVSGWPSRSPEFEAVYRNYDTSSSPGEFYAEMFAYALGDYQRIPEDLRGFYDWDTARELLMPHLLSYLH